MNVYIWCWHGAIYNGIISEQTPRVKALKEFQKKKTSEDSLDYCCLQKFKKWWRILFFHRLKLRIINSCISYLLLANPQCTLIIALNLNDIKRQKDTIKISC